MRMRELSGKTERLIDKGDRLSREIEKIKGDIEMAQMRVGIARQRLEMALSDRTEGRSMESEAASRAELDAATRELEVVKANLEYAEKDMEAVNAEKNEVIKQVDRYNEGEKKNLSTYEELQTKRFGANANAFVADLISRMNSGEESKSRLLQSMGIKGNKHVFSGSNLNSGLAGYGNGYVPVNTDAVMHEIDVQVSKPRFSMPEYQIEHLKLLKKKLIAAGLLDMQLSQPQQLEMLMRESDNACTGRRPRTPTQILEDTRKSIRENWMNNFNADQWKSMLTPSMYKERLELFRTGLSYELGDDVARGLTTQQLEQFSRERNLAYLQGKTLDVEALHDIADNLNSSYTDSKERAEHEPVEIQRESALHYNTFISKLPKEHRMAVHTAYAQTPKVITDIINRHSGSLTEIKEAGYGYNREGQLIKKPSYYSPTDRCIAMSGNIITKAEYVDVLKHEMGHFIDHELGSVSTSHEFVSAIQKELESYDLSKGKGDLNVRDMLDDAFSTGACYDRNVTDILSALFNNNLVVTSRFHKESVANYRHENDYWARRDENGNSAHTREKEIFANVFAIKSDNCRISANFVERWLPSINSVFEGVIKAEVNYG